MDRKQKYDIAKKYGATTKQARAMRSYGEKRFKQELKALERQKKNQQRKENYNRLRQEGFSREEANKYKGGKPETVERHIQEKRNRLARLYLCIVYKDITEESDTEYLENYKGMMKRKTSRNSLVVNTVEMLLNPQSMGELGTYEMDIMDKEEVNTYMRIKGHEGFKRLYVGQGKNLKTLESIIAMAMSLLYENWRKYSFIMDLVKNLNMLDNTKAHQNARIIEKEYLENTSKNHF